MSIGNTFRLGGVTPVPWLSKGKIAILLFLIGIGVTLLIVVIRTSNLFVVLGLAITVGAFVLVWRRKASDGSTWVLGVGEQIRYWIGKRARWDDFDPVREAQPFLLMDPLRLLAVPASDGSELAVLDYPEAMVCVLEISGHRTGVQPADDLAREQRKMNAVHKTLADPKVAIDQVDWLTLVRPENPEEIAMGVQVADDLPETIKAAAEELSWMIASHTETMYSYLVIRFNKDLLYERVAKPPFSEFSGAEAAYDAVSIVARKLETNGIFVKGALGPAEVSALIRAIVVPHRSPYDLEGCEEGIFASCPSWIRQDTMLFSSCDDRSWWHASASFGLFDWPLSPVRGRWLEPLVFGVGLGPRTVVSQVKIIRRHKAREFAKDQLTTAASERLKNDESGKVDAGEAWSQETVATEVAQDIVLNGQVGIIPAVRIMISANSPRGVKNAMADVASIADDSMNAEGITMDDTRPGVGLLHCLPLGMEVPSR